MNYQDSDQDFMDRTSLTEEEQEVDPRYLTPDALGLDRVDVVEAIENEMEAV